MSFLDRPLKGGKTIRLALVHASVSANLVSVPLYFACKLLGLPTAWMGYP
jgi:hypothetical protein